MAVTNTTQLLCTFTSIDDLDQTVQRIRHTYTLSPDKIYVLASNDTPTKLYCTYNVELSDRLRPTMALTVALHRKKHTNTLFTINALNALILQESGTINTSYQIDWNLYRNSFITYTNNEVKVITTTLQEIV